jgi:hypothetical protein
MNLAVETLANMVCNAVTRDGATLIIKLLIQEILYWSVSIFQVLAVCPSSVASASTRSFNPFGFGGTSSVWIINHPTGNPIWPGRSQLLQVVCLSHEESWTT